MIGYNNNDRVVTSYYVGSNGVYMEKDEIMGKKDHTIIL